jgi:hypothetical protein
MGKFSEAVRASNVPKQQFKSNSTRGTDYIRTTNDHPTTIRIIDSDPVVSWSHFVPKGHTAFPSANAGKGMSFMCPGPSVCPICKYNKGEKERDLKSKLVMNPRRVYSFNVVDRTPVVVCPACQTEHFETKAGFPEDCSNTSCGASLVDVKPISRNKIQIMQKGKKIIDQLDAFDSEFGDITKFDIKLETMGTGDQSSTVCIPKQESKLDLDKMFGTEWKTEKLYKIKDLVKPLEPETINKILKGDDFFTATKKA